MLEHPRDVVPIINLFCEDRQTLLNLLDERFEEIDALDGKSSLNYKWIGTVISIDEGFMFIESIFN